MANIEAPEIIGAVRQCLVGIGYREDLVCPRYKFWDFKKNTVSGTQEGGEIDLVAFGQSPPSLRSACIGVTASPNDSAHWVSQFQALGAPQVLALNMDVKTVRRWKIVASGPPEILDEFAFNDIRAVFTQKREDWNPRRILTAKTLASIDGPAQLDFMDFGLLAALEAELRPKLDRDIQEVIVGCRNAYAEWHVGSDFTEVLAPVFRLIFRLIAAKMLIDRGDKPEWIHLDAESVVREVEAFYFRHEQAEQALDDEHVRSAAWHRIRTGLDLQNLSVETLAYVYENAFVTDEKRRDLSVHATPQEVAQYVVRNLPIEQLDWQERTVFEPFSGAAPYLTAALGRLRELLPVDLSLTERHDYFVRMLRGLESDPFAREIARYSLILADYPNPDGWHIDIADAYRDSRFEEYLKSSNVVLCNPPHEDFAKNDRNGLPSGASISKAAEALRRVLDRQPRILGFLLPRTFLNGRAYRQVRQDLVKRYRNVSVTVLPDKAFQRASQEVVILLADNVRSQGQPYAYNMVTGAGYDAFLRSGEPTWSTRYSDIDPGDGDVVLWRPALHSVWDAIRGSQTVGDVAELHVGVRYKTGLLANCVSDEPGAHLTPGVAKVPGFLEEYTISNFQYLSMDADVMHDKAYKWPWSESKILINRAVLSRQRWSIAAAVDQSGLWASQQFYGVWPKDNTPVELLAALLNGPIANAFLFDYPSKRDNQLSWINRIPIPRFSKEQEELVVWLVEQYCLQRSKWIIDSDRGELYADKCLLLLYQIDASILEAYGLPPELERELLAGFEGVERRPLPFRFPGYGEEYEQAREALQHEKQYRATLKHYHTLVDKKYLDGLTEAEAAEMERLRQGIGRYNAPFYEAVMQNSSSQKR